MANENANYGGYNASTQAARGLAYGVELQLERVWNSQFLNSHPVLDKFKKMGADASGVGPKLVFPVWVASGTTAAGVSRANEVNAVTAAAGGGSQAEVQIARYVSNQLYTQSELDLYAKSSTSRGSIMAGRAEELAEAFLDILTTDLFGSVGDDEDNILGIPFALQTSATLHGISQTSHANWKANVTLSTGTLDLTVIDRDLDILRKQKRAKPDMIVCSSSTVKVYELFKGLLTADTMVTRNSNTGGGELKGGYEEINYRGCDVVREHNAPNGELYILDSSTWGWYGDKSPKVLSDGIERLQGKLSYEHMFHLKCAVYCKKPRNNWRYTGITA